MSNTITENEISALSTLSQFGALKHQRDAFAKEIIAALEEGQANPLIVHLQIKSFEDVIARLTDKKKYPETALPYNQHLANSAAQYPGKSFEYLNGKFETKEAGVKYDFSQCNDAVLVALYEQQAAIDKAVKDREALLKTAPAKGLIITDEATGETCTVYPPSKTSTTTIALTLK